MLTLDLRRFGSLADDELVRFEEVSYASIDSFHEIVRQLSEGLSANEDWWAQPPASRNTYASSFFHSYCIIAYLDQELLSGKFDWELILVDTYEVRKAVKKILANYGNTTCEVVINSSLRLIIRRIRSELISPIQFLILKIIQLMVARVSRVGIKHVCPNKKIIIVDTFSMQGHIGEERWYGNFWIHAKLRFSERLYFSPTIIGIGPFKLWRHYRLLRKNGKNLLIREDFLQWKDIFFAILSNVRIRNIKISNVFIKGINLSGLVKEEIFLNLDRNTSYEALLTYRFFKNLKKNNVEIDVAIDWFEGQILDKLWNLSIATFYPKVNRFGYRPYAGHSFYLSMYPIRSEEKSSVIPSTMLVTGKGLIKSVRKYFPEMPVIVIPSFRHEYLWRAKKIESGIKKYKFLVALPISDAVSYNIIKQIVDTVHKIPDLVNVNFLLRTHPVAGKKLKKNIKTITKKFKNFYISTNHNFAEDLALSELLITEASSVFLESIALGVPVILIMPNNGIGYNPIPEGVHPSLYRLIRRRDDLERALIHFSKLEFTNDKIDETIMFNFKDKFFEPISDKKLNEFFSEIEKNTTTN